MPAIRGTDRSAAHAKLNEIGKVLFARHGDAAIVRSEDLHATLEGSVDHGLDSTVHTKVDALHHAGEHSVTISEVILVSVYADHKRRAGGLVLGFKMLCDGFQIANAQRARHVVDNPGALRKHSLGGCLTLRDVAERAGIRPEQTDIRFLASLFCVLCITPVHAISIARFKLVQHRYFDAQNYTNLVIAIMRRDHRGERAHDR